MAEILTTVKQELPDDFPTYGTDTSPPGKCSSPSADIQVQFPWLVFDVESKGPICKLCRQAGYPFELAGLRHEALVGHTWTSTHKDAEKKLSQACQSDQSEEEAFEEEASSNHGNEDNSPSSPPESPKDGDSPAGRRRKFCKHWLGAFPWLYYDKDKNQMFCTYCLTHRNNGNSTFIKGTTSFRITTIHSHAQCRDHQLAERAHALERCKQGVGPGTSGFHSMTDKQQFLLGKYLKFFPWLLYNPQVNVLVCDVCQRHGTNNLYLDCGSELDYSMLRSHADNRRHVQCEEMEIHSWSVAFDVGQAKGCPPEPDEALKTLVSHHTPNSSDRDTDNLCLKEEYPLDMHCDSGDDAVKLTRDAEHEGEQAEALSAYLSPTTPHLREDDDDPDYTPDCGQSNSKSKKGNILPAFGTFKQKWVEEFPWIAYDAKRNLMFCILCAKYAKNTTFARGVKVFSRSYIIHHTKIAKHRDAAGKEGIKVEYDEEPAVKRRRKKSGSHGQKNSPEEASDENETHSLMMNCQDGEAGEECESLDTSGTRGVDEEPASPSSDQRQTLPSGHKSSSPSLSPEEGAALQPSGKSTHREVRTLAQRKMYKGPFPGAPESQEDGIHGNHEDLDSEIANNPWHPRKKRVFCDKWYKEFPWLEYRYEDHSMICVLCSRHGLDNTFTRGNRSFHAHTLKTHEGTIGHQKCLTLGLGAGGVGPS